MVINDEKRTYSMMADMIRDPGSREIGIGNRPYTIESPARLKLQTKGAVVDWRLHRVYVKV